MKLSDFLAQANVSIPDFADKIGVSRQSLHRYLNGERFPRPETLRRIRDATDGMVTANDFFGEPEGATTGEAA